METNIVGDSVSLEVRVTEGPQATIDKVKIRGNDIVYEDVVRRELYTKPGVLFSKEDLMNSFRILNQLGHFDAEKSVPKPVPNPQSGTVDIEYDLTPKSNDQLNLSIGWSQTGIIGSIGLPHELLDPEPLPPQHVQGGSSLRGTVRSSRSTVRRMPATTIRSASPSVTLGLVVSARTSSR